MYPRKVLAPECFVEIVLNSFGWEEWPEMWMELKGLPLAPKLWRRCPQSHRRQTSVTNGILTRERTLSVPSPRLLSGLLPFLPPDDNVPFPHALSSNGKCEPVYTRLLARIINQVTDPTGPPNPGERSGPRQNRRFLLLVFRCLRLPQYHGLSNV